MSQWEGDRAVKENWAYSLWGDIIKWSAQFYTIVSV